MPLSPGVQVLSPGVQMFAGEDINTIALWPPLRTETPLTGATIVMDQYDQYLLIDPAGTIAALTIRLPANPQTSQMVSISFTQIVTALTIQNSTGGAVSGGASAGAVSVAQEYRRASTANWRRWA